MDQEKVSEGGQDFQVEGRTCPVFGVESGGPLIGLGFLLILFAIIPLVIIRIPVPVPFILISAGFGVFLIWAGVSR